MLPAVHRAFGHGELAGLFISSSMPDRVILYIDAQNVYKGARESFLAAVPDLRPSDGNTDPIAIGNLICDRPPPGRSRTLHEVRIYSGRPDATKDSKGYAANMRQCAAWEKTGAIVIARSLRYPSGGGRPQEKGIDVRLAIDFVTGAIDGKYDVGVIFSTDTDLRPALEYVAQKFDPMPRAEVAAWRSPTSNKRISFTGTYPTWCHYLDEADFDSARDFTVYGRS